MQSIQELSEYARYQEHIHMLEYKFFPRTEWCAYYADTLWPIPSIFTYGRPRTMQELMIKCLSIDGYNPTAMWARCKAYLAIYDKVKEYESTSNSRYSFKAKSI